MENADVRPGQVLREFINRKEPWTVSLLIDENGFQIVPRLDAPKTALIPYDIFEVLRISVGSEWAQRIADGRGDSKQYVTAADVLRQFSRLKDWAAERLTP